LPCGQNRASTLTVCGFLGFQFCRDKARDGRTLPWRVLRFIQACQARSSWCSSFLSRFSFSLLTILQQIGATHCKLLVEFMTLNAVHDDLLSALVQHLACAFICLFVSVFCVSPSFSAAFPSSSCTHMYCSYTVMSTAQKVSCVMLKDKPAETPY
jgi:hypothetical protein